MFYYILSKKNQNIIDKYYQYFCKSIFYHNIILYIKYMKTNM